MRIALIGAPGSGKSDLAQVLSNELLLPVVDDYVPALEERTNIAMGYLAELVPNLMCAAERFAEESFVHNKCGKYIVCGTVVESACYASMRSVNAVDLTTNEDSRRSAIMRANAAMDTLTMILMDTWVYDHAFYLPLPANHEDDWDKRLDHSIRECLSMLNIDHTPLTDENRLDQAMKVINDARATATSE